MKKDKNTIESLGYTMVAKPSKPDFSRIFSLDGPQHCCRLDEETIIAIVRNRSGIDAGEIDYTLRTEKFDNQSIGSLKDMIVTMHNLIGKCQDRIVELSETK
jgi:hypothetical protein